MIEQHATREVLELRFAAERSGSDRQLFYVVGGLLAAPTRRGRLELRTTPSGDALLTAIHDFEPALRNAESSWVVVELGPSSKVRPT